MSSKKLSMNTFEKNMKIDVNYSLISYSSVDTNNPVYFTK